MKVWKMWFSSSAIVLALLSPLCFVWIGSGLGQQSTPAVHPAGRFQTVAGRTEKGTAFLVMTDTCTGSTFVYRFSGDAVENRRVNEWQAFTGAPWERPR